MAEQKIEQAEAQAMAEVRSSAVDLAVAAAEKVIAGKMSGKASSDLIKPSIEAVKTRLN